MDKNNFIQNILNNKKFFNIETIRYFINNIIGNYLAYKYKIKYELLVDILQFEISTSVLAVFTGKKYFGFYQI